MQLSWIEPGILAASDIPSNAADVQLLHAQGIRAIITLTEKPLSVVEGISDQLLERLQIQTLHLPVSDFQAMTAEQVKAGTEFVRSMQLRGNPVLVHCYAGQGRTGMFLHAYYLSMGWSLESARNQVMKRRIICRFDDLSAPQQRFLDQYSGLRK